MRGTRSSLILGLALLFACGDDGAPIGGGATGGNAAGGEGAGGEAPLGGGADGGAGGGASCAENEVALLFDTQRLYVPVEVDGQPALFFIDTGSSLTFLNLGPDGPNLVEDAAELTIGCETLTIPGRGGIAPLADAFGQPVVGFLGADYLIASSSLLDIGEERLVRPAPSDVEAEAASWPELSFDNVQGHMIAPVTMDGEPLRLMIDTGAYHSLWLGEQGQPGDQEIESADAQGNPLTFYLGEVELTMADRDAVTVPILRAPSFPYFEATVAALGGNIHGLLGLTSFRERALLFDGAGVRLGPVPR